MEMTDGHATDGVEPVQEPVRPPDRTDGLHLAGALRTLLRHHRQMGIEHYPLSPGLQGFLRSQSKPAQPVERRVSGAAVAERIETAPPVPPPATREKAGAELRDLGREIEACCQCSLASARHGVVYGSGSAGALLIVVGDYSAQSEAFSAATLFGAAEDAMLWNMMRAIHLAPEQVHVTNVVKCCPLAAEKPGEESIRSCQDFLLREIELVRPKVVCAMGEMAVRALTGAEDSLVRLRGRFYPCRLKHSAEEPVQVMVTFHPRFLLHNPDLKKAAWQDLQLIQRQLRSGLAGHKEFK